MLVQDFLERAAANTPDRVALVCGDQRLTYAAIDARANRVANALRERGVLRGDRVVLWCPNSSELVVSIFAVLKAGGVFIVLHDASKPDQVAYVLRDAGAKALVTTARHATTAGRSFAAAETLATVVLVGAEPPPRAADPHSLDFDQIAAHGDPTRPPRCTIDRDLACLIYTSGSTGEPKGVMSAHHQVVFASGSIVQYLQNTDADVVLCALPLSFDYGLYQLLMMFRCGGTLVLERSFAYPAACLERIAEHRVTGLPGVPTMFALLLDFDLSSFDLSSLRYLTNTAASLPPGHITRLRERFPGVLLYSMYGLTETKRALYLPPEHLDTRPGSVGIAIPGTEVWLENERGERLPSNQVGELVIRGGHVMSGYWQAPEATAHRFRPGPTPGERVCHSGDLFTRDEAGFYYFVGRADDLLKCRGEKVAPKEVENVLHELPAVREAAVVGVADPVLGQAIVAVVVRRDPDLSSQQVLRHCHDRLDSWKVPQRIEFVASLPRTDTGKVHRAAIVLRGDEA